jgi:transcription factor C subunit 3
LIATNLPNIPFGFEPGNYESRKYPKSYYHFGLDAVPADTYLYNDQIGLLRAAHDKGPPRGDTNAELPQWVDFFGKPNKQLWSEILGAFCFTMATRGPLDVDGIRSCLHPILDEFEARLIMHWGKETGVLTDFCDGLGLEVGEWWWLVIPWLRRVQD